MDYISIILNGIFYIVLAVLCYFVIPFLKNWLTMNTKTNTQNFLSSVVSILVANAEQIFNTKKSGNVKYEYVFGKLKEAVEINNIKNISDEELEQMILAEVFVMNRDFKSENE